MKRFYSFVVWSPGEVPLPEIRVLLEQGTNSFNCVVDAEELVEKMMSHGVRVIRQNCLDDHEPLHASDIADVAALSPQSEPSLLVAGSAADSLVLQEDAGSDPPGGDFASSRPESPAD